MAVEEFIPISRGGVAFRGVSAAVFTLLGIGFIAWGVMAAVAGSVLGLLVLVLIGVPCVAAFGPILVGAWHSSRSRGLRLTSDGFQSPGEGLIRWRDVAAFEPVGSEEAGITHIRVVFRPDAELSSRVKLSRLLGRIKFYGGPAYLPLMEFATGDTPLVETLRWWWAEFRLD